MKIASISTSLALAVIASMPQPANAEAAISAEKQQVIEQVEALEARADVLVFTSEPLEEPLEVSGFVDAVLSVSSDARDTDFTVKLVDVLPDGTAYIIDDTILRARYRDGYDKEVFMEAGEVYEINFTPMTTSIEFQEGHRIRVEVSSSSFPKYVRNLNTGGNNVDESEGVVATNTLHHSPDRLSYLVLPIISHERHRVNHQQLHM